jgi:hypothetical protein
MSPKLIAAISLVLFSSVVLFAQEPAPQPSPDTLSGRYEGVAKSDGAETPVVLEIKREGARISGNAKAGETTADITEGTFTNGALTLKFGTAGSLTAKVEGDKITGDWMTQNRKGMVELKKVVPGATIAAAPINLSGEWEAVADANGQNVPFALILKIEGEKVTGSSSSQLGESVITSGSWKDGQLNFVLEGASGNITMNATVIEGKLSGLFDFAGQLQGKWVAVKKK